LYYFVVDAPSKARYNEATGDLSRKNPLVGVVGFPQGKGKTRAEKKT
jgi:hypothetical protein